VRLNRVHVDNPIAGRQTCELSGSAAHHVSRVLRLRMGAPLVLFDGEGGEYLATIAALGKNRVSVAIGEYSAADNESQLEITLVQGISRADRMDLVIQKATELGVTRVVPIATERSVMRADETQVRRKLEHWRGIATAACEQCGRNRLPEIGAPLAWQRWLSTRTSSARSLLLARGAATPLGAVLGGATSVELLIGPEGGLAPDEEAAALAAGFRAVKLGPRVLRTETAAIAAIAAIQHQIGDL